MSIHVDADYRRPFARRIEIRFPYDEATLAAVKAVPGAAWDRDLRVWAAPPTLLVRDALARLGASFSAEANAAFPKGTLAQELVQAKLPTFPQISWPRSYPPYNHQARAAHVLARHPRALLADEMGLGKTATILRVLEARTINHGLVLAPRSALHVWPTEAAKFPGLPPFVVLAGGARKRALEIERRLTASEPGYLVTTYDIGKTHVAALARLAARGALIGDEIHQAKGPSKRASAILAIAERAPVVYMASGTPAPNSPLDLYVPLQIAGSFWRSRWEFESRYAQKEERYVPGGRKVQAIVGTKNEAELNRAFAEVAIRRTKAECLELPPKIRQTIVFDLDPRVRRVYDAMRKELVYAWEKLDPETPLAEVARSEMERLTRLYEICSGYLRRRYGEETRVERLASLDKVEVLRELLEDGASALLIARFSPTLAILRDVLGAVLIEGETSSAARAKAVAAFEAGETRLLAVQVQVAEGFTANAAERVVFLERSWTPGQNAQAEDRAHRIGRKGPLHIVTLRARKTVEEHLQAVLETKERALGLAVGEAVEALRDPDEPVLAARGGEEAEKETARER